MNQNIVVLIIENEEDTDSDVNLIQNIFNDIDESKRVLQMFSL